MNALHRNLRILRRLATAALVALCALPLVAAGQQADYTVTDLGAGFRPEAISNNGLIVGTGADGTARLVTTDYDGTTASVVSDLPIEAGAEPTAVNQRQVISGFVEGDPVQPRLWQGNRALPDLEAFAGIRRALGLNDFDEVVGGRLLDSLERPFWYDAVSGTLKTLTTLGGARGWATDINNAGQVVGTAEDEAGNPLGFIYDESRTEDEVSDVYKNLGTLDGFTGSTAVSVNDGEDIVGWMFTDAIDAPGRRAMLSPIGNSLVNLGTLQHDTDSVATAINNGGQIVGHSTWADGTRRAFIYDLAETDLLIVKADPALPNRVYTASTKGNGIFRSDNRGDTWTEINRGLTDLNIQDVTVQPGNSNILFAGGQNAIFKSEDAGVQWRSVGPELEGRTVYAIHVNSGNTDLVLAGTNGGMYYSFDGGESWTLFRRADSEGNEDIIGVFDFIEVPYQPFRMYAATDQGVYRIDIEGNTIDWSSQNGDGERKLTRTYVTALAIPPQSQDRLFAATSGGGVWMASLNEGFLRWEQRADGMNPLVSSLEFLRDETLYAGTNGGLFVSEDYGTTWEAVAAFGANRQVYTLSLSEDAVTTLYATTSDGAVLRSDDADGAVLGAEWTTITRGVDPPDVYKMISAPDDPNTIEPDPQIYLAASSGAYRWDLDENAWAAAASTVKNDKLTALAMDATTTPTTLWAGSPDQGLYKSVDGGRNWFSINTGLGHWGVRSLAVDTSEAGPIVYAGTMGGIYRSDDGGDHWAPAQSGMGKRPVYSLLLDTSVFPRALYAGTDDGVYRSVDNGLNWIKLNSGMEGVPIVDLAKDFVSNILYAATTAGALFKSTDFGASWERIDTTTHPDPALALPDATLYAVTVDSFSATVPAPVYVGTPSGVYRGLHAGGDPNGQIDWSAANAGIENLTVYTLTIHASDALYAGTRGNAVYRSRDGGTSWEKLEAGLSDAVTNMQDLTALLGDDRWVLREATDINASGQIVGVGELDGQPHGFLLTPTIGLSSVDVAIEQITYPESVKEFTPVTYIMKVTNHGPDVATGVTVTGWIPPRTLFRYVSTNYGECRRRGHTVRCSLKLLEAGQSALVNLSVEPQEKNIKILNIARVVANERDTDFSNNTTSRASGTVQVDRCFIATAAYGSLLDPHVATLRQFRDEVLMPHAAGRYLVGLYYEYSPPLAALIAEHEGLRMAARVLLAPIVYAVEYPAGAAAVLLLMALLWRNVQRKRRSKRCNICRAEVRASR